MKTSHGRLYWGGYCPKCKGEMKVKEKEDGSRIVFCTKCNFSLVIRRAREKSTKVKVNGKEVAFRF